MYVLTDLFLSLIAIDAWFTVLERTHSGTLAINDTTSQLAGQ